MITTLLLVRHAHTAANELDAQPRMSGWTDVPLSAKGEAQVRELRNVELPDVAPLVYASDLSRAVRTAAAFRRPIRQLRSLREINCGSVDGWSTTAVQERYPELWQRNEAQTDDDFRWPEGESYREFRHRVVKAIRGIAARHAGERVIVVTHTGVITQLLNIAYGLPAANWQAYRPNNATITEIAWKLDEPPRRALIVPRTRVPASVVLAGGHPRGG